MSSRESALRITALAMEKKARFPSVLEFGEQSTMADYFVILSGTSTTHVKAVADHIEKQLAEEGRRVSHREGYSDGHWILLDYGTVVVHLFTEDTRQFYNLERLWSDAPEISLDQDH